jgi:hypothetical protein
LKLGEFLYSVTADELTIRSDSRTFRFKSADGGSSVAARTGFEEVRTRLDRLRSATPAR